MKSKYLRTFENYKNVYLNEEDKDIEDVVEDDEIETESEKEDSDTEEVEPKEEVDEVAIEETPASQTETSIELNISLGGMNSSNDLPTSTGFNPSDNFSSTPKAEWCVIKCMTNNGERLGIDKECDTDCEVLCGGLHYDDAVSKVEELSRKCDCQAFDNDNDIYLGKVSKYFIKKPIKSSGGFDGMGSYK